MPGTDIRRPYLGECLADTFPTGNEQGSLGMATVGNGAYSYEPMENWAKLPPGWSFKEIGGVGVDRNDNVFVFNRGEHPMIVFDREGNFLRSFGEGLFPRAHGVFMAPDFFFFFFFFTCAVVDHFEVIPIFAHLDAFLYACSANACFGFRRSVRRFLYDCVIALWRRVVVLVAHPRERASRCIITAKRETRCGHAV